VFAPGGDEPLPESVEPAVQRCLAGITPIRSADLVLAIHRKGRQKDEVRVLLAEGDATAATPCLADAVRDLAVPRGWSLFTILPWEP